LNLINIELHARKNKYETTYFLFLSKERAIVVLKSLQKTCRRLTFRQFRGFGSSADEKFGHNAGSMSNRTPDFRDKVFNCS